MTSWSVYILVSLSLLVVCVEASGNCKEGGFGISCSKDSECCSGNCKNGGCSVRGNRETLSLEDYKISANREDSDGVNVASLSETDCSSPDPKATDEVKAFCCWSQFSCGGVPGTCCFECCDYAVKKGLFWGSAGNDAQLNCEDNYVSNHPDEQHARQDCDVTTYVSSLLFFFCLFFIFFVFCSKKEVFLYLFLNLFCFFPIQKK